MKPRKIIAGLYVALVLGFLMLTTLLLDIVRPIS